MQRVCRLLSFAAFQSSSQAFSHVQTHACYANINKHNSVILRQVWQHSTLGANDGHLPEAAAKLPVPGSSPLPLPSVEITKVLLVLSTQTCYGDAQNGRCCLLWHVSCMRQLQPCLQPYSRSLWWKALVLHTVQQKHALQSAPLRLCRCSTRGCCRRRIRP